MNIQCINDVFKYGDLLKNSILKDLYQRYMNSNINLELYSLWTFVTYTATLQDGHYIFLGLNKNNNLIFLEYAGKINGDKMKVAPYDTYINQISIQDFNKFITTKQIQQFNFPIELEQQKLYYILSYFSTNFQDYLN